MFTIIPDNCNRCQKKCKGGQWATLPIKQPVKRGKAIVIAYTPMVYLCRKCVRGLGKWMRKEVN